MLKSVLKEIFIILLLSIAIILILGILFYGYIPINKDIPTAEAYITPNEVQKEMNENIIEENTVTVVTYEITGADLNVYEQTGSYPEGKANPFALQETTTNSINVIGNNVNNNTNDDNNTQTNIDNNSTGTFFNEEGIK